jgi:hypothetical protein
MVSWVSKVSSYPSHECKPEAAAPAVATKKFPQTKTQTKRKF